MNRKISIAGVLSLVAAASSFTNTAGAIVNTHGASWGPYNGTEAQYFIRNASGITNTSTSSKYVSAGIPRIPHSSGLQTVYIDGSFANSSQSVSCTIGSQNYDGTGWVAKSFTISGVSGAWEGYERFDTTEAGWYFYYNAYCNITGSSATYVLGAIVE